MSAAVAAILEGMPEPRDLRMHEHDGRCVITAGRVVLFEYAAGDAVMRNIALAALRQLGFKGRVVAAVLGLTENYVATLHNAALRDGSAALVMQDRRGTPGKVTAQQWEQARAWRAQGASDAEIGRRLQVAHTTIGRALGPREQEPPGNASPAGRGRNPCSPAPGRNLSRSRNPSPALSLAPEPGPDAGAGLPPAGGLRAWPLPAGDVFRSRYAGAMLLHAFGGRAAPGRSWRLRRAGRTGGPGMRRCCQRSACASRWGRRPLSSSSTWPRRRQGRWPGWRCCRGCGRCGLSWPRSPAALTRWKCSACSPPPCWPRTRSPPACTTSMTISCPIPGRNRWARAGTTSGAGRRGAARTRTSPRMTGGRCAS